MSYSIGKCQKNRLLIKSWLLSSRKVKIRQCAVYEIRKATGWRGHYHSALFMIIRFMKFSNINNESGLTWKGDTEGTCTTTPIFFRIKSAVFNPWCILVLSLFFLSQYPLVMPFFENLKILFQNKRVISVQCLRVTLSKFW